MRISDSLVERLLASTGKVSKEQLSSLLDEQKNEKKPLQDVVVATNTLSEKELTKLYAAEIDVPYVEFNPKELPAEVLNLIPDRVARQYRVVAFKEDADGVIYVAMEDPDDIPAVSFVQKQLNKPVRVHITGCAPMSRIASTASSSLRQSYTPCFG